MHGDFLVKVRVSGSSEGMVLFSLLIITNFGGVS
jgi:hypothetical protein